MTKWMVGLSARRVITREGGSLGEGMKILMGQKYTSSPYSLLAMVLGVGYAIIKQNRPSALTVLSVQWRRQVANELLQIINLQVTGCCRGTYRAVGKG